MNEIHTETFDVHTEPVFCIGLLSQDDDQEEDYLEELPEELVTSESDAEEPALVAAGGVPSLLDSSPELAPFQLDQEALFRELIAQHQRRLYRFVIKYIDHPDDAADITQQAFVEAARTIASFRGDSKLSTWLFGIAMNMVRNYMRKMIEQDLYDLPVLSYQELTAEINIQPLARVEL